MNSILMIFKNQMKKTRLILIIAFLTIITHFGFSKDCDKCDTDKLIELSENLDNLNYKTVKNFICAFDLTCKNNIEFSEWSNELLFKLIEHDVNLLNRALNELGFEYVKLIGRELETPVIEFDLKKIYVLIQNSKGPKSIIEEEKKAIRKAAKKEGIKLE